ncbi:hypothetical protein M569_16454, partial [Genlisea aurea]
VSLPDLGELTIPAMKSMYDIMKVNLGGLNLWQLDGRPMSGDIGKGATMATIKFAVHLVSREDRPQGFLQLAGGANGETAKGLKRERLLETTSTAGKALISGVGFGGHARKIVGKVLWRSVESAAFSLENFPDQLLEALWESIALVGTLKSYNNQIQ